MAEFLVRINHLDVICSWPLLLAVSSVVGLSPVGPHGHFKSVASGLLVWETVYHVMELARIVWERTFYFKCP